VYQRFHDVIVPSRNGTSQIDHILVSQYGLFIVETKNLGGWIFGSEENQKWTQSLYGQKYQFQNPLRQAYRQKKVLSEFLEIDEATINIVVLFVGDCKFKTSMPSNVIKSGIGSYIKKFRGVVLSPEQVDKITATLNRHISESGLTKKDHLKSLHQRHNSPGICPKCGSAMVERKVKKGSNAGSTFLGCGGFPKCRYTKNA
jgi:restriction system protein